ncbi:polyketide synthase dehydratase domain-containing protein [Paenibacillus elgii]|uniref:polyketide synthase dehydratase domain-containing protein n=1 Tax=Paenibacillus elgii TaxID=189691 RepID=UPI0009DA72C8
MDACFQAPLAAEFPAEGEQPRDFGHEFRIPVQIGSIRFYARADGHARCSSTMRRSPAATCAFITSGGCCSPSFSTS